MNCQNFLAEFEERDALSQAAQTHLNDCQKCRQTSGEQTRVWQMIDNLKRVDAPKDFDFHVRARIANHKPEQARPALLPILRYVLPLGLVLMVIGLFAFNSAFFFGGNDAGVPQVARMNLPPTVADNQPENFAAPEQFAVNTNSAMPFTDKDIIEAVSNQDAPLPKDARDAQFVAVKSPRTSSPQPRRATSENGFDGNSHLKSLTSPLVRTPENFNTNKTVGNLSNEGSRKTITDEEIWAFIGLEIARENGKRTVKAITENSSAHRSGIKVGDVVEAIDGEKLSAEPIRAAKIQVKKLTVARGSETIEINLQN